MTLPLISIQIFLPLALIGWIAFLPPHNRLGFWIQVTAIAVALFAMTQMGLWVLPPWWTPYLYALLFVLALIIGWRRRKILRVMPSSLAGWLLVIGFVAFGVYASNEALSVLRGRFPPSGSSVDLAFPLRGGDYMVLNGGNDIRLNAHLMTLDPTVPRFRAYRGQSYGVDLVKLDRFGLRARGLIPRDLAAYYIYGEPVFAPCTGTIVSVLDGLPDMKIPDVDRKNLAGNHAILRCGNVDVVLAHFRPKSLVVQQGAKVKVGDRIAEVGNSGNSAEPHLHISAQRPGSKAAALDGDPVTMRFENRYLVRNMRIEKHSRQGDEK